MKILEINTEKTWRGGERQTFFALKGFKGLGHTVELLAREYFPLIKKSEELEIKTYSVKSHLGVVPFLMKYGKNYDILHVQTASLLTFAVLTKPFHNCKVVYTRRLDFVPKGWLTRWKYNQADLIVAISTPIKTILETIGVKNIVLIPECIEAKSLDKKRALKFLKENGFEGKKIIGTTSALVQHKDPQTLVKAIALLANRRSDFIMLHFGDGVLRNEVEQLIVQNKLSSVYKLAGFVENVEDFFSIFDVFVMSSEEEGLGSSVLDAFIYKVPVVSTNAGGLAELLEGRGTLVNIKDPVSLCEALDTALENSNQREYLVNEAFRYASDNLTIEMIHKQYTDNFKKLIEEKEHN
ncbi:MAG: glycosyltransferase family 4 protein [Opitutaceae bacterium]|nr:glycosyltransferase family 4 protein [Cytophagales bacterium]